MGALHCILRTTLLLLLHNDDIIADLGDVFEEVGDDLMNRTEDANISLLSLSLSMQCMH